MGKVKDRFVVILNVDAALSVDDMTVIRNVAQVA
jgi:hypothetical protein